MITYFTIQFRSKNLTNFAANMFLFGVRKNICTAPFLDAQELHSSKTLKANVCIFLYTYPQENVCSKGILPSIKVLRYFHVPQAYFHLQKYFATFIYSIKTLKFSRKLRLQG